MTDAIARLVPEHAAPLHGLARAPGVVRAAAMVTWIVATGTAALTLLLAMGLLLVLGPVFEAFASGPDNPRWFLLGVTAAVVALSTTADVVAVYLLRGHRWARWTLVVLAVVAAVGGLMSAYLIVPLAVTGAAVAVVVLLLLPESRGWFQGVPCHSPAGPRNAGQRGLMP